MTYLIPVKAIRPFADIAAASRAYMAEMRAREISRQMSEAQALLAIINTDGVKWPVANAKHIVATVAAEHGVTVKDIMGDCRTKGIVEARHEAMREVKKETGWSTTRIGVFFHRDRTSIMHALDPERRRRKNDYKRAWEAARD